MFVPSVAIRLQYITMDNATLINEFYDAFALSDAEAMVHCYHEDITFQDPVFGELKGKAAGDMWRMLLKRNTGMVLTWKNVSASESSGSADWQAIYTFSATGRYVINRIHAEFEFRDGKIYRHIDDFDFWKWSRQALGLKGYLLGWTPFLRNKVRTKALSGLARS
jgi:ketosteroid isomerase-like protein